MPVRQPFTQTQDQTDPFLAAVGGSPMPSMPSLPMAGGDSLSTQQQQPPMDQNLDDPSLETQITNLANPPTAQAKGAVPRNPAPAPVPPPFPTDSAVQQPGDPGYVGAPPPPSVTTTPAPPPATTTTGGGVPLPAGTMPDWANLPAAFTTSVASYRPDTQNWVGEMLNKYQGQLTPASMGSFVNAVNSIYGLPNGQGAEYFSPGAHGPGSGEVIALPGGYFAHQDNDPSKPFVWVASNEGASGGQQQGGGTISVGNDPTSLAIQDQLSTLWADHGMTPDQRSVFSMLQDIIKGGSNPLDDKMVQNQMESAREAESGAFTSQLNDANAELANRGLASEPGIPQGEQGGAIARISQGLAPSYSGAVRDIQTQALARENDRILNAVSNITGLTGTAASNLLSSLGQGTDRQVQLARLALDSLGQNQQWNEFLATYGLNRDQLMYQIQNGNSSNLLALLTLFGQLTGISAGGHF